MDGPILCSPFMMAQQLAPTVAPPAPATVMACTVYFWARLVHPLAYTLALPRVRTLALQPHLQVR